jgi:hypothetical protein
MEKTVRIQKFEIAFIYYLSCKTKEKIITRRFDQISIQTCIFIFARVVLQKQIKPSKLKVTKKTSTPACT